MTEISPHRLFMSAATRFLSHTPITCCVYQMSNVTYALTFPFAYTRAEQLGTPHFSATIFWAEDCPRGFVVHLCL